MSLQISREQSLYKAAASRQLDVLQHDLAQVQEHLSTGRRINRPSDDAVGFARARRLEALEQQYAQYQRSIETSHAWVDHTQAGLDAMAEVFMQASEEALRGANATATGDYREAIANRVENLRDEVLDTLNTKFGDEYLFAGTRTIFQSPSPDRPFEQTATGVVYQGNDGERLRPIGPDMNLAVNINGERVLDTGDGFTIMESLQNLIDSLRGTGATSIEEAMAQVETARDHLVDLGSTAGNLATRLDYAHSQIEESQLLAAEQRSNLEDTDFLEATMHFQKTQTTLQAALKVTASVLQTSLLDYLR